jgi:hypothetical protein
MFYLSRDLVLPPYLGSGCNALPQDMSLSLRAGGATPNQFDEIGPNICSIVS